MEYYTAVQKTGGTLTTSIPKFARDLLNLEKGNKIAWIIDTQTGEINIKKVEE